MTKNLAVFALVMLTVGTLAATHSPAFADWVIDTQGNLTHVANVLGDQVGVGAEPTRTPEPVQTPEPQSTDSPQHDNLPEAQKQATERRLEAAHKQQELKSEMQKKALEQKRETVKFLLEASKEGQLSVKENLLDKNGKTVNQKDVQIPDTEKLKLAQPDGKSVEVDAIKTGGFEIGQGQFKAQTKLPLSVNANNELQITRPDGTTKIVTVLPDQVAAKLGQIGQAVNPGSVQLTTNSAGNPVYVVDHQTTKKFLGLFNVQFGVQTAVSATDSNNMTTTTTENSPLRRLLEQLSF